MNTRSLTILALSALAIPSAHAAIAFNNFDTGDAFNTGAGSILRGDGLPQAYLLQGYGFNAAASGQISLIKVAIGFDQGAERDVTLRLFDDASGSLGSLIASWTFTATTTFPAIGTETIVNSNPLATLTAGNDYWLVGEASFDSQVLWAYNSIGDTGPHARSIDGGTSYTYDTNTRSAFRVEVEPVPEPASIATLGIGALALIRRRRSRKA